MNDNSFQDNLSKNEEVKEEPSALREKIQASSVITKDSIDEMLETVFIKDKKTGEFIFISRNFGLIWSAFVKLQNSFDNEVYIVNKCLKKAKDEPHLLKAVFYKIYEFLLYDYKRCPTWRHHFQDYYGDIIDWEGIEKDIFALPEAAQERLFPLVGKKGQSDPDSDSDEEESDEFWFPGESNQKRTIQDWD